MSVASDPAFPSPVSSGGASPGDMVTSRHVVKGAGTTLLARLGAVIEVITQPLYVWLFGLSTFGLYVVFWAAVNLVENIADLGQTSALQRTVPQAHNERGRVSALFAALLFGVGPCVVIAAGAVVAAPWLGQWIHASNADIPAIVPGIRLFAWALPLWALIEIATSALRAKRLFGPEIRLRIFWEQLIRLIFVIAFWAMGWGVFALFAGHVLSLAVTALLAMRLVARHYDLGRILRERLDRVVMKDTLLAGLSFLPTNIVGQLFADGASLVLNLMVPGADGARAAALYSITRKIASVIQLVRTAFAYVLMPLASAAKRIDHQDVQNLYAFTTRLTTALVVPMALVLAGGGDALLDVFGPGARVALPALVVMIAGRMVEACCTAAKPVQQAVSRYRQQFSGSLAGLGVAAGLAWLLIPYAPLIGAATAVAIGIMLAAVLPVAQLRIHDGLWPFVAPFGRILGMGLVFGGAGAATAWLLTFLPGWFIEVPLLVLVLVPALWGTLRFGLPIADRLALGKTARRFKLIDEG